ncbi:MULTISPECIES: methyl-accepting chemotaxis protein [Comamonas]|uniref:methyl-accepting chemotaxis protein n=1 Tax=Comamonas TaxID=283 RepID=UPI00244A408D|nr:MULTISPECIES: methyl-accepting chemotaxis protein [Comamonas]MDI9857274.1 methyl-accepting chemotaxis protein [Comamonas sp. 17RB]
MRGLFQPAVALMSRLRLGPKFLLAGIPLLLMLGLVGAMAAQRYQARVQALEAKRAAVALMADLVEWNQVLIESRRVAITGQAGDAALMQSFQRQAAVVDKTLAKIEARVAAQQRYYDMRKETEGLQQGWKELQGKIAALPADADFAQKAFAAHAPEYARLYAFMRDLGNRSGLAQDPDADIFYLGYPLANHTPSTAGIAVRIAAYALLNVSRGVVDTKDKVFYEVTEARLNDTFSGVETQLSQSMQANAAVQQALGARFDALKATSKELLGYVRKHFTLVDQVAVSQQEVQTAAQPTIDAAWALVSQNGAVLDQLLAERGAEAATQRNLLVLLLALGIGASVYLYVGVYLSMAASLAQASQAAKAIAAGDLGTVQAPVSKDEFARLLEDLRSADRALAQVISGVKESSESIATATSEIASGTQSLSSRTELTASSLQQTAGSMAQLTDALSHSRGSADSARQLSVSAGDVARRGGTVVQQVVQTMDAINQSSRKIADIIGVIDGIAFQTNILALNAAVEAARAGEQGRGFAVVASEVRALAGRSAEAAKQIKDLIGSSVGKVDEGARLVSEAGATMHEIVDSVVRVDAVIGEISVAAGEQSQGIAEINTAVGQLDDMTQQNAALVEQSAAAAESLREQARLLAEVVGNFRIHGGGERRLT